MPTRAPAASDLPAPETPNRFGPLDAHATARFAASRPAPKLADMIAALDRLSAQMDQSEGALVAAGLRADYNPKVLRDVACLEAAMYMLARIRASMLEDLGKWPHALQETIKGEKIERRDK